MTHPYRKPTVHPMLSSQISAAGALSDEVKAVANYLGELLKDIHGGHWDIMIDHQVCFVTIAKDMS